MNKTTSLVESFCTPPPSAETEFDRKVLADARTKEINFEDEVLRSYSWGEGESVLLVHGWGSRASHLALLARHLARSRFGAVVVDAPSHGHSLKSGVQQSSMFEFGRAISAAASEFGPLYAVVGHSLGALAALFASAGYGKLAPYRMSPDRLVLISSPLSIRFVIDVYCRREGLDSGQQKTLTDDLERAFDFSVSDYTAVDALVNISSELLIVHDEEDPEVPFSAAVNLHAAGKGSRLVATRGAGHEKILADRTMLRSVREFLRAPSC